MELTAKEILEKHFGNEAILAAMKEACELAWDTSWKRFRQEEYAKEVTAPTKHEFINSLFPESK